ncbi:MAG TPA: hypothetical protein VF843_05040, partial [Streptosporangiaceae bacterium]
MAASSTPDADAVASPEEAAGHQAPDPYDHRSPWERVVLKLSGEAFAGGHGLGIDPDAVSHFAREIRDTSLLGVQV